MADYNASLVDLGLWEHIISLWNIVLMVVCRVVFGVEFGLSCSWQLSD